MMIDKTYFDIPYYMIFIVVILMLVLIASQLPYKYELNKSIVSRKNKHSYSVLAALDLVENIFYTFKCDTRKPNVITIYKDEGGNTNFAISHLDSEEYSVGEMINEIYENSDGTFDEIKFEWLSYNSDGETKKNDVVFQRLSSVDSIRFRCVIYEQFEFKSNVHVKQVGYSGYQLS